MENHADVPQESVSIITSSSTHKIVREMSTSNICALNTPVEMIKNPDEVFYHAVVENDLHAIEKVVNENGVDINMIFTGELKYIQPWHKGLRSLHIAVHKAKNGLEFVSYLVSLGADVSLPSLAGDLPLHVAAKFAQVPVLKFLLEQDLSLKDHMNHKQLTPLVKSIFKYDFAWRETYRESVKMLLESGANPNLCPSLGLSPLHLAAQKHDPLLVEMLVKHNADVNALCSQGTSPLLKALLCSPVNEKTVRILVAAKADVNIRAFSHRTALHIAVTKCDKQCVEDFLLAGADPNAQDNSDVTPLWTAVEENNVQLVPVLVQYGGDVNYCLPQQHLSVLSCAIKQHSVSMTNLLIKLGACVNTETIMGATPLHFAVSSGNLDLIKLLLDANCELEVASNAMYALRPLTPLQLSLESADVEVIQLLLQAGCQMKSAWLQPHRISLALRSKQELLDWIAKFSSRVPTLAHMVRLVLRCHLGSRLLQVVQELRKEHIPGKLADYLLLKDLTCS